MSTESDCIEQPAPPEPQQNPIAASYPYPADPDIERIDPDRIDAEPEEPVGPRREDTRPSRAA